MKEKSIKDPFLVPEGYFDSLTERVMKNIPESESQRVVYKRKPLWLNRVAAAVAVVVVVSAGWYGYRIFDTPLQKEIAEHVNEESYIADDFADYAMLDHQDIYELLIEE